MTQNCEILFERKHAFHNGAELDSLRWIKPGKVFVAAEHPVWKAVIFVQLVQLMP